MKDITLLKFLIYSNIGSRRVCFNLIKNGFIRINTQTVYQPLYKLVPEDKVYCEDKLVKYSNELIKPVYIMLYKPQKYICSLKDENNKPSIMRLIRHKNLNKKHLFPVGRLDFLTEGLIFITNDGYFADYILRAKNKVLKSYYIEIKGKIGEEDIKKINRGIYTEKEVYRVEDIKILSAHKSSKLMIVLSEGKNREIRNIFSILKYKIKYLKRTKIGPFKLDGELKPGEYKLISKRKIDSFLRKG